MTDQEVLRAIDAAITALEAYRQGRITETASKGSVQNTATRRAIIEKTATLLKEAFMAGPSGAPCRRCGGSGREP
jgi:hypothetical protein